MSDSTTTSSGKILVTPEMVDAVLEILPRHGQNQAGLAVFAGVSASTVSGIVKAKARPTEYRLATWDGIVRGLKQLMQSTAIKREMDEARLKQLLSVLNIREPRISLPGDILDGSWDNYVQRGADADLCARLDSGQSALLCTKGGHKTGHSSLLREFTRNAERAKAKVYSINLAGNLIFDADWSAVKFHEAILTGMGIDPKRVKDLDSAGQIGPAMLTHFMEPEGDALSVVVIDDLQRSIMSYDEKILLKQNELARQLPLIFNRVVEGLRGRAGLRQVIFLIAGPMPYYHINHGAAFHQSRLSMQEHNSPFLTPEETKRLFESVMGHEPADKQLNSMRNVLLGHPYLVQAAISDLRRSKHPLPEEPVQFCHHSSSRSLMQRLESTYRTLAASDSALPKDIGGLIEVAQSKKVPSLEQELCVELGIGDYVGGAYRTLPPLEYHYRGKTS